MPKGTGWDKTFRWTDEMDKAIEHRAYQEGLVASLIARQMNVLFSGGDFTKSKVIARLHRLRVRRGEERQYASEIEARVHEAPLQKVKVVHLRYRKWDVKPAAHPFISKLYTEMNRQQVTGAVMEDRSGVSRGSLSNWRFHLPKIADLEACFNVLGMTMLPHQIEDTKDD